MAYFRRYRLPFVRPSPFRRRRPLVPLLVGLALLLVLQLFFWIESIFQNLYLGSFLWVPGSKVANTYWASIRFALTGMLLLALLGVALAAIAAVSLYERWGRRRF